MSAAAPPPPSVIRSAWSLWPRTRSEANQLEVPLGLIYTPFGPGQMLQAAYYEPLRCRQNNAVLNPLCHVDFKAKVWNDPFSGGRNAFPPHYASQISEQMLPAELQYSSIDYVHQNVPVQTKPTFCFVVDLATYNDELESLKESLQQAVSLLPSDSQIALITYAASVFVHELGFPHCVKCYVFRGSQEISQNDLVKQLRLPKGATGNRFVCPIDQIESKLTTIIDEFKTDATQISAEFRASRCTGAALSAAVGLMEMHAHQQPGRIILFTGGICTVGPGAIVETCLTNPIRQHQHLAKDTQEAKNSKAATAFYSSLAQRVVQSGHTIDVFSCALDQTGLHEMRVCCERTGGLCIMSDTFSLNVFKDSLRALCTVGSPHSAQAYNLRIEIITSKDIKVAGCVGCVSGSKKKSSSVSDTSVGEGNTCEWLCGAMDTTSSLAFYLDVTNTNAAAVRNKLSYVQFQVSYTHPSGEKRLRVHTIAFPFCDSGIAQLGSGFDQEAATALMARLAVSRADTEETIDILRWLDRKLIRLCSQFADFQKDAPDTFQLGSEFAYYPCFMFHLRRSPFLDTFNASPDETAFYRLCLLKENLANTVTMISPSLLSYSINNLQPVPCLLDSKALRADCVLLMDSYFHIIVWRGDTVSRWKDQGYHEQPEYKNVKLLLETPVADARMLLNSRIPCPKFVVCSAGGSQERFLLARVNPSNTHRQDYANNDGSTSILTGECAFEWICLLRGCEHEDVYGPSHSVVSNILSFWWAGGFFIFLSDFISLRLKTVQSELQRGLSPVMLLSPKAEEKGGFNDDTASFINDSDFLSTPTAQPVLLTVKEAMAYREAIFGSSRPPTEATFYETLVAHCFLILQASLFVKMKFRGCVGFTVHEVPTSQCFTVVVDMDHGAEIPAPQSTFRYALPPRQPILLAAYPSVDCSFCATAEVRGRKFWISWNEALPSLDRTLVENIRLDYRTGRRPFQDAQDPIQRIWAPFCCRDIVKMHNRRLRKDNLFQSLLLRNGSNPDVVFEVRKDR